MSTYFLKRIPLRPKAGMGARAPCWCFCWWSGLSPPITAVVFFPLVSLWCSCVLVLAFGALVVLHTAGGVDLLPIAQVPSSSPFGRSCSLIMLGRQFIYTPGTLWGTTFRSSSSPEAVSGWVLVVIIFLKAYHKHIFSEDTIITLFN